MNDDFEDDFEELEIVASFDESDRALDEDGRPMISHSDAEERLCFHIGSYLNGAYDHIFEGRTICERWKDDPVFHHFYVMHNTLDAEVAALIERFKNDPQFAAECIEKIEKRRRA